MSYKTSDQMLSVSESFW